MSSCEKQKKESIYNTHTYINILYIYMCVGAEEVLDSARPKKANKSKGRKKKQSKHKNNKQTFYGCHCRKLGLGLGLSLGRGRESGSGVQF